MTINEFIAKYNSDKFDSYIKDNATIDYWHDLIKTYKLERLKFVFPDAMQLTLNPLLQEGNDIFFGVAFDRFCERQIKILEIKQQHKPQEPDSGITEEINYANDNIENVRNQIKESYPKDLILFLTENPLADEAFYLKRELKGYKKALKTLNKDTAFNNFSEVNEDTPRFRNFFFRITESCNFFKLRLKELQQPENGIMAANEYVLLIVNSYFDAQESLGNEPDLINLVKDLFQQTILRFGKKQETENFMTPYEFNSRIYFALTAMMQCGYNDDWETSNSTKFMRIETIIKDIKRPISRIEFKNIGDWIEELISINEPQQTNTIKTEIETKNILTNDTYYNILENCTIEAFESLKLKELYPKNGTKAIWDVSSLKISKGDGLPTDNENNLFRKEYIIDDMRVTFLMALDRHWKDFEIKHAITRTFFYKKCYQSLLFKISQSPLWNKPDFGFDINAEPCNLTFIWNMRTDIEARSKETKESKPQQNPPEQTNTNNTDEALLKNEYIKIFKNDLGFTLFTKMFELYKPDNKDLANFSFLFFAMEKDFLVCSQVDFVKFLEIEKYNVSIEKIDNRQFKWQINKKSKLYNSIKEPLQKKHEKSTI